ncbi:MAG: hypothetical protein NC548_11430 [Lachnospiraceae bacterium]|nr:hypothetical protein [Lachnospiraceae bacterium]MCM1234717.1 hypothetical protein [Ruminococcus flavefaciens]
MRSNESVDMMKWAIALLLLCLLIGATLSFFYMLYDNTDRRIDSMQKAATSSNMDRLYDLQDNTLQNSGDIHHYPLCSNVVSALTEFNEDDLLYISVITPDGDTWVFTYGTENNADGNNPVLTGVPGTVSYSQIPVTMACRLLLGYSDCRSELVLGKYDVKTGSKSTNLNSPGLLYIQTILYNDPIAD